MNKRKLTVWAMVLCAALLFSGCASAFSSITGDDNSNESGEGGYYDGRIGDTLTNTFFSYTVEDAYLSDTFEGKTAEDGMIFLVSNITVRNEFGSPIPMWSDDFQVQWGEGDEDYGFPIPKFHDSQMEDEFEMKSAEKINKICVFEIPRIEGENEYSISYLEIYEDGSSGDVFFAYFELEL